MGSSNPCHQQYRPSDPGYFSHTPSRYERPGIPYSSSLFTWIGSTIHIRPHRSDLGQDTPGQSRQSRYPDMPAEDPTKRHSSTLLQVRIGHRVRPPISITPEISKSRCHPRSSKRCQSAPLVPCLSSSGLAYRPCSGSARASTSRSAALAHAAALVGTTPDPGHAFDVVVSQGGSPSPRDPRTFLPHWTEPR